MNAATLLLIFYLFLPPAETTVCNLWVTQPPTAEQVRAACGDLDLEKHRADFVDLTTGLVVCSARGDGVMAPDLACNIAGRLDGYRMDIIAPAGLETLLCAVASPHNPPTWAEISAQCDPAALVEYAEGRAQIRLVGTAQPPTVEQRPEWEIDFEQVTLTDLDTAEDYHWLAGRLIWFGLVKPACPGGWSGLDPETLAANACGMEAAREKTIEWQNQFNTDILTAAKLEQVPADLLKKVIAAESQFWPLWGKRPADELGLAQITPPAIDQYLRWYDPLYPSLSVKQQAWKQAETLAAMRCELCNVAQAIQKERENILIYARILKAYRLAATDWHDALVKWNGEEYAKKVY